MNCVILFGRRIFIHLSIGKGGGGRGIGDEKREFRCIVKRSGEGKIEMQVKQNSDEDRKFNRFIIKIVRYLYEVKKHLIILLHFITLNEYIV